MTYEEFQAGLAETPELINTIFEKHEGDFTKRLTDDKKMVVTTMADYTKDREKAIGEGSKKAHEAWEAKFETVTGQKRPEGKKGLEWFDELSSKIKFMTEEGKDPESPLMKAMKQELADLKTSLSNKDKEAIQARSTAEVSAGVRSLTFAAPAHLKTDAEKAAYQKSKAAQMIVVFNGTYTPKVENGQLVYVNAKNEAQVADGEPMTADQIAARDFVNDLMPKGRSQGGTGSTEDGNPNTGHADYLGKDTDEISKKLAENGKARGTDEWMLLYAKAHVAIGVKEANGIDFQDIVTRATKK